MSDKTHEGLTIDGSTVTLRNVGDGLSSAVKVDAQEWTQQDEIVVVVHARCVDVSHPLVDQKDPECETVVRHHVLRGGNVTLVAPESPVGKQLLKLLDAQGARIQKAADELNGQEKMEFDADPLGVGGEPPESTKAKVRKPRAPRKPRNGLKSV